MRTDGGVEFLIWGRTFVGRSPSAEPPELGGRLVEITDPTMSMSKNHALFDVVGETLRVTDLDSTNGTFVVENGLEHSVDAGTWREVARDSRILLGDRWIDIVAVGAVADTPSGQPSSGATDPVVPASTRLPSPPTHQVPNWCPACDAMLGQDQASCTTCGASLIGTGIVPAPPADAAIDAPIGSMVPPSWSDSPASTTSGPPWRDANDASPQAPTPDTTDLSDVSDVSHRLPEQGTGVARRRRSMAAGVAAAMLAILVGSAVFVVRRSGDSDQRVGEVDELHLPRAAELAWERTLPTASGSPSWGIRVTGGSHRVFVHSQADGELQAIAQDGATIWAETASATAIDTLDGDLLLIDESSHPVTLSRRSGDDGSLLWRIDVVASNYVAHDRYAIFEAHDSADDATMVQVVDLSTGQEVASESFALISFIAKFELAASDGFVVYTSSREALVVDEQLAPRSAPVPVGENAFVTYQSTSLLVVDDDELARFDLDGKEVARDEFPDAVMVLPVGADHWAYQARRECGVLEFSGPELREVWSRDDCFLEDARRLDNSVGYLTARGQEGTSIIEALTGQEVLTTTNHFDLVDDGAVASGSSHLDGYSLPDGATVFSYESDHLFEFDLVDEGFVTVEPSQTGSNQATIALYK